MDEFLSSVLWHVKSTHICLHMPGGPVSVSSANPYRAVPVHSSGSSEQRRQRRVTSGEWHAGQSTCVLGVAPAERHAELGGDRIRPR